MNWILLALVVVVDCASAAALPADAPASGSHPGPPAIAGMPSPSSDPAAAARNGLTTEAIALLQQSEQDGGYARIARPWHEARWLNSGPGKVGRLYDMCTGAVEPPPALARGAWTWGTLDPRGLSPAERRKVLDWRAQQVIAQYGCGTFFVVGPLGGDARRTFKTCPYPADNGVSEISAFIAYVHERPDLRARDDLTGTLVAALRERGCS